MRLEDRCAPAMVPAPSLLTGCGAAAANNTAPSVDAGADRTLDEQTSVTLTGAASDGDGPLASVVWTQVAGPDVSASFAGADTPSSDTGPAAVPERRGLRSGSDAGSLLYPIAVPP